MMRLSRTFVLTSLLLLAAAGVSPAQRVPLNDGWHLSSGARNMELPVTVPGTLYGDLLRHGLAANVMNGNSEADIQWIENGKWIYTKNLIATDSILMHRHAELVFEGLDTYAKVYVNDSLVITAVNMFREWRVDVRGLLKKGNNHIRVEFLPASELAAQAKKAFPYRLPQTDTASNAISSFVRKAAYHFGWDFAPRIPDRGIWRPVYLELWDHVVCRRFTVSTLSAKPASAHLEARVVFESDTAFGRCRLETAGQSRTVVIQKGRNEETFRFQLKNPRLWWPNGSGEPLLTRFEATLTGGSDTLMRSAIVTGIRTVELIQKPDSIGTSFYFQVNGKPVYMMGANYVSPFIWDTLSDRRRLVTLAKDAGMNMLRVWGGGVYEDESFYSSCDSSGILIWQDLMFACAMYPGDSVFIGNVQEEVRQNAARISAHPCLALWCGNNESDVAWKNWGWQKQYGYTATDSTAIADAYRQLFVSAVPAILKEADPNTAYIHTSPLSNWGKKDNFNRHNMHYWGVWHGEESIDSFRVNVPRFMTEYGMQSYPSYASLARSLNSDTVSLHSPQLSAKQKSYKGNRLLFSYIADRYRTPNNTEELCYLSQLTQADALEAAVSSHRKAAGRCMGTLFWQLNDVWPGASWSAVEHDGTLKAPLYRLKDWYARHFLIPETYGDLFTVTLAVSDTLPVHDAMLTIAVFDFSGQPITAFSVEHLPDVTTSGLIYSGSVTDLLKGHDRNKVFVRMMLTQKSRPLTTRECYFVKPNQLQLTKPAIQHIHYTGNGHTVISLRSDVLAKGVYLRFEKSPGQFSDNYFDLLPGVEKKVIFDGDTEGDNLIIQTFLNER